MLGEGNAFGVLIGNDLPAKPQAASKASAENSSKAAPAPSPIEGSAGSVAEAGAKRIAQCPGHQRQAQGEVSGEGKY